MTRFLALYSGQTVGQARLIAVSANAELVALVSERLLDQQASPQNTNDSVPSTAQSSKQQRHFCPCGLTTIIPTTDNESNKDDTEAAQ